MPSDSPGMDVMHRFNDPTTDAEHDFIINAFSKLCEIVPVEGYDQAAQEELQSLFHRYTSEHFSREEALMQAAGYPQLELHIASHACMQEEFLRALQAMRAGHPNLRADLHLLRQVFLEHILTHDEVFGEWLAARLESQREPHSLWQPTEPSTGTRHAPPAPER